ncbi:prophage protein [Clostridium acetobutylicum]|nr:prophage protein [Clostridium acetobutylicum]
MSKFVQTDYGNKIEILKFADHFVALNVMVDDAGVTVNADGKKIVPAGTIIGGGVLANGTGNVTIKNTQGGATGTAGAGVDAEGVLLNDVDVTYGPASGAMILHGFVDLAKLPATPCADAVTALKGRILFLK